MWYGRYIFSLICSYTDTKACKCEENERAGIYGLYYEHIWISGSLFSDRGREHFSAYPVRSDLDIWRLYDYIYQADGSRSHSVFYIRLNHWGAGPISCGDGIDTGKTGESDKGKAVSFVGISKGRCGRNDRMV